MKIEHLGSLQYHRHDLWTATNDWFHFCSAYFGRHKCGGGSMMRWNETFHVVIQDAELIEPMKTQTSHMQPGVSRISPLPRILLSRVSSSLPQLPNYCSQGLPANRVHTSSQICSCHGHPSLSAFLLDDTQQQPALSLLHCKVQDYLDMQSSGYRHETPDLMSTRQRTCR